MQRPENDIRENLRDLRLGNDFLVTTVKAQAKKEKKQINWILFKLKIYSIFFKKQEQLHCLKVYLVIGIACRIHPLPKKKTKKRKRRSC